MVIKFNEDSRKHELELSSYEAEGRRIWSKYQEGKSLQTVFTPFALVVDILEKLEDLSGKDILVVANVEIFTFIKTLKKYNHIDYKSITFLTDNISLTGKEGIKVVDFINISKVNLDMKFDVVIGNPPYNDSETTREGQNHRKQARNLAKEFLYFAIELSSDIVSIIGPTSRTYTSKVKKDFLKNGLYEVQDVTTYFPNVNLSQIVTYTFSKKDKKPLADCTAFPIPERNLGHLYTFTTGFRHPRAKVEPLLKDSGKYKVYVTTSVVKYTDSEEVVNFINDKSRGRLRVVMNHNASKSSVGKMHIAYPDDILTYSTDAFYIESEEQGLEIIKYLNSEEAKEILQQTRTTVTNSARSFSALPIPF